MPENLVLEPSTSTSLTRASPTNLLEGMLLIRNFAADDIFVGVSTSSHLMTVVGGDKLRVPGHGEQRCATCRVLTTLI